MQWIRRGARKAVDAASAAPRVLIVEPGKRAGRAIAGAGGAVANATVVKPAKAVGRGAARAVDAGIVRPVNAVFGLLKMTIILAFIVLMTGIVALLILLLASSPRP